MLTADTNSLTQKHNQGLNSPKNANSSLFLQDAAEHLKEHRDGWSRLRAKDLVSLLLCHGARAWRASQPVASIRIRVGSPLGGHSVSLKLK
ncbi:hypothetical protein FPY71_08345 [Aureimonas fodinaquatilis]|uniref:Uncharacterized protein n=1 Tax=Aureimonas fodinaquatilis TaxID=2565783 RepID=A0A5B0DVY0_9HYPH|nr:hypothetical protein [Aureimonas fodinaquatilis]KAA0970508.1 hypothetical protein FPY71_08345 [Aureimonas fodinaquatilis]